MDQLIDIPPSERSYSEARMLLREFSHRINNEFASAIGLISIAATRSANNEAKAALVAVQDQLQNYAQVHHALQMPEHRSCIDAAAYLRQLCRAIHRSKLDSRGIELLLVERTFQMDSERCWRLGLIVSELITNAARHAFRNGGGLIRVELMPSTSFVECRVIDNGAGEANISPGGGLKIIAALAEGLGGTIDQHFGPQGSTSVLIFPANR
jgi:two-component sensor histidine kinase